MIGDSQLCELLTPEELGSIQIFASLPSDRAALASAWVVGENRERKRERERG